MDRAVQEYLFWKQTNNPSKKIGEKIRELCTKFKVTRVPLRRRLGLDGTIRRFKASLTGGASTGLRAQIELTLVRWLEIRKLNKISPTLPVLQRAARKLSDNPNFKASKEWWKAFKERHKDENISLCKPEVETVSRAQAKTEVAVRQHFDALTEAVDWVCEKNGVEELGKAYVGNVDEKPICTRRQVRQLI